MEYCKWHYPQQKRLNIVNVTYQNYLPLGLWTLSSDTISLTLPCSAGQLSCDSASTTMTSWLVDNFRPENFENIAGGSATGSSSSKTLSSSFSFREIVSTSFVEPEYYK